MNTEEQVHRDIVIALDFARHILDNPDSLDDIPDGAVVTFLDDEYAKGEVTDEKATIKKYIKVKRQFETL